MKKVLLPGIIGGLAVFVWSFISHMVLPIGEMGVKTIQSNEEAVISAMKGTMQERGFYMVPGIDMKPNPTAEQQQAWQAKWEAGPTAIIVYNPAGSPALSAGQLLRQLLFQILCGLIAAYIVSAVAGSVATRAIMVMLMGVFAWLTVNVPQWNWYSFPSSFTIGQGLDHLIGWLIGGFVIAWLIQRAKP